MARKNFTAAILKARRAFAEFRCEWIEPDGDKMGERCNVELRAGRWHGDHDIADRLGGKATFENCRALCIYHHGIKTKQDAKAIGKVRRLENKEAGANQRERPKMQGRQFPQTKPPREPKKKLGPKRLFA